MFCRPLWKLNVSLSLAMKKVASLRGTCKIILQLNKVPIIYEDNKVAVRIAKSKDSQFLKYVVNLCCHYITYEVADENIVGVMKKPTMCQVMCFSFHRMSRSIEGRRVD